MHLKSKPILLSLLSGSVWAMIGYGVGYSLSPIRSAPSEVGRMFLGGILAAPLIGLLLGRVSRNFTSFERSSRLVVALGDLYLATWLFLLTSIFGRLFFEFSGLVHQSLFRILVFDPLMASVFGLTYTGYFVALWPLSYWNHVLVARAWNEARLP